jgi:GTPase SAR1 family protein
LLTWGFVRRRERARMAGNLSATLADLQTQVRDAKLERDEARKAQAAAAAELADQQRQVAELQQAGADLVRLKDLLARSSISKSYFQPVLVVGPRNVGKTSLVKQWEVPWDYSEVGPSAGHRVCEVPITTIEETERRQLLPAADVHVRIRRRLGLRVHDFPGEIRAQRLIANLVREETERLRAKSKKNLGVVIICMFDAEEAQIGVRPETYEYYNGELFRELRHLVAHASVGLERLILVFNKFDLLRAHYPVVTPDRELLELCQQKFGLTCAPLLSIVNPERICRVVTVLGRGDLIYQTQGGPVVKGEAARPLVEAFLGVVAELDVLRSAAVDAHLGH